MFRVSCMFLAVLAILAPNAHAFAAEAVGVEIKDDGKNVAGYVITHKGESDAELWMMLRDQHLTFERDYEIPVDENDPTRATLTGDLQIHVHRRGDTGVGTSVAELRLEKRGDRWFLTDAEIERTREAAGLALPPPPPAPKEKTVFRIWLVALGLVAFLFAIAAWIVGRSRISPAQP